MARNGLKVIIGMFLFVMIFQFASAITFSGFPSEISQNSNSFTFTVLGAENLTVSYTTNMGDIDLSKNVTGDSIKISYDVSLYDFELKEDYYYITVNVKNDTSLENKSQTTYFSTNFCGVDSSNVVGKAKLQINIEDIDVSYGFGEDEEFYPLDTVEIEIEIENTGSWDLEDVEVEWALYNTNGDLLMEDEIDKFDLDEDDSETITFEIELNDDIDQFESYNDLVLYVKANGNINDRDSDNYDGDSICSWDKETGLEVIIEKDFVIPYNLEINSEEMESDYYTLSCGSSFILTGELYNIGSREQEDVLLEFYSKNLGIFEEIEFDEIREFDSEDFSITLLIPENITEGNYRIEMNVYDEDKDLFENKEDDVSRKIITIKVENCKASKVEYYPTVNAKLEGEAKSGNQVKVISTIFNQNSEQMIYTVTGQSSDSWMNIESIKPEVVSIDALSSKDVEFILNLEKSIEGEKTFDIVVYNIQGEVVLTQPVTINVEKSNSIVDLKLDGFFNNQTVQIVGIILLDVILLVIIFVVVRRIMKKRK